MPAFDICDADKLDGGLTLEEIHAPECLEFIASVGGDAESADPDFAFFDADGNGVVTVQEFFGGAIIVMKMNAA